MTLGEVLLSPYQWANVNVGLLIAVACLFPAVATALAWIGRGGRTDADGVIAADVALWLSALAFVFGTSMFLGAHLILERPLLDINLALLVVPPLTFFLTWLGVTRVFPAHRLGFTRVLRDGALFMVAALVAWWVMRSFRGWGVVFFGSLLQLLVLVALGVAFLYVLWRRLFARRGRVRVG